MKPRLMPIRVEVDRQYGSTAYIDADSFLKFPVRRVSYIYDTPGFFVKRHYKKFSVCNQFIVALGGSVKIKYENDDFLLESPDVGLFVPPGNEIEITEWSLGTFLLVLYSHYSDIEETSPYLFRGGVSINPILVSVWEKK